MRPFHLIFVVAVAALAAAVFLWTTSPVETTRPTVASPAEGQAPPPTAASPAIAPAPTSPTAPGATASLPPPAAAPANPAPPAAAAAVTQAPLAVPAAQQIETVWNAVETLHRIVKGDGLGGPPPTTNADFTARLLGGNRFKDVFLEPGSYRVNEAGELVDAWDQPYYFHLVSSDFIELRSGGADRRLWTADDLIYPPPASRAP